MAKKNEVIAIESNVVESNVVESNVVESNVVESNVVESNVVESLPVKTSKLTLPTFESTTKTTRDNALYNGVCVTTHILKNQGLPVVRFFNGINTVSRRYGELKRDSHSIHAMELVSTEPKSLTVIECAMLGLCKQSILNCETSRNAIIQFLADNGKDLKTVIAELTELGANDVIISTLNNELISA